MTDVVLIVVGALVGLAVGWFLGMRRGAGRLGGQVGGLVEGLRSGRLPEGQSGSAQEFPPLQELRTLLTQGWVRRGEEREGAIREAFSRIAQFLRRRVEVPLLEGLDAGGRGLRAGAGAALDAVEDLEFFLEDPPKAPALHTRNLVELVQEVTREFASQSKVLVKVTAPPDPVRVSVDAGSLEDAIFLVLHNAAEFGGGAPVGVSVVRLEGKASLRIRDQGPGFTADAFVRAFDPLYSTSPEGLGMGLPYARKALTAQGGEIVLRNRGEGGAEVEILLPLVG